MLPQIAGLENYSDLDASIGRYVFSTENGRLCSVIRIRGSRIQPVKGIYNRILAGLSSDLSPLMEEYGHCIHVCEQYDSTKSRVAAAVNKITLPSRKAAEKIGMDISWLIDSRNKKLVEYCSLVEIYMAVWTIPKEQNDKVQVLFDSALTTEVSGIFGRRLFDTHSSYVNNLIIDLKTHYIDCELLNCYQAGEFIHQTFNPNSKKTPKLLPRDVRFPKEDNKHNVLILPAKLNKQMTEAKVFVEDFETIRIGNRIYTSFDINHFPAEQVTFQTFAERAAIDRLPYRFSMMISSRGDEHWKAKYSNATKLFSFGDIRESYTRMANYAKEHGGQIVTAQASVTTWVDISEHNSLNEARKQLQWQASSLQHLVKNWGKASLEERGIDPIAAYVNTIPGLSSKNGAPISFPPLKDACSLLPLYKVSNAWENTATCVFRSTMGELLPFKIYSKEQPYNLVLIQGTPGTGKSNLINDIIINLVTAEGNNAVPLIGVVDIKPSSFGSLRLIRASLPDSKKHHVVMETLRNDASCSINPNDLLYGAREPTAKKFAFLKNFWTLVCRPIGSDVDVDPIGRSVEQLLSACYASLNDKNENASPKIYKPGVSPLLDSWLENENVEVDDLSYWDLFDYFHDKKEYAKASHCQKLAMPDVDFMMQMCRTQLIAEATKSLTLANGKPAIDYIYTVLSGIHSSLPVIASHSRLDFADARCVSLDIQPLIDNHSLEGARISSAIFMLATEVVTSQFTISIEDIESSVDRKYHDFLIERHKELSGLSRTAIFDEMHMMNYKGSGGDSFSNATKAHIQESIRVNARSSKIGYILASQLAEEFKGDWTDLYTNAILFKAGSPENAALTTKIYGLPKEFEDILPRLPNPSKAGSSFIMINKMDNGKYINYAINTLPAEQIWGTTTTNDDVRLLKAVVEYYGDFTRAIKALTVAFPSGSCVSKSEELKQQVYGDSMEKSNITEQLLNIVIRANGEKNENHLRRA